MLPPEIPFLTTLSLRPFGLTNKLSESPINRMRIVLLVHGRDQELEQGVASGVLLHWLDQWVMMSLQHHYTV